MHFKQKKNTLVKLLHYIVPIDLNFSEFNSF